MSFTTDVKEELIALSQHEKSELSAIIKLSGNLGLSREGLTLSVSTENAKVARHIYALLSSLYQAGADIRYHQKTNLKKNRVYQVFLDREVENLLNDLHLADSFFGLDTGIASHILAEEESSRAYLRGAFLASGSVKDPDKGRYQLEIASTYSDHAKDLAKLMQGFLLDAKVIERKKGAVTYLQRAEDIMDFFIVIGAMTARDSFETAKMMKETRNDLNRANNVETANIARTMTASVRTINNIVRIDSQLGLDSLPPDLRELAELRINHPDYSIQQLADSLTSPLSKSGVNHRLRKLNKIADDL